MTGGENKDVFKSIGTKVTARLKRSSLIFDNKWFSNHSKTNSKTKDDENQQPVYSSPYETSEYTEPFHGGQQEASKETKLSPAGAIVSSEHLYESIDEVKKELELNTVKLRRLSLHKEVTNNEIKMRRNLYRRSLICNPQQQELLQICENDKKKRRRSVAFIDGRMYQSKRKKCIWRVAFFDKEARVLGD